MAVLNWIIDEARAILLVTLYFVACFGVIMLLKQLMLAEYGIEFRGLSIALLAALVTAKVVIVLEKVPLAKWLGQQAAITDIVVRSAFYTAVTLLFLLLEKAIESQAGHGGLVASVANVLEHRDVHQVWATTICVGLFFIAYNSFSVLRREIGGRRLAEIFLSKSAPASAPH
ncbi:MAG: hypothetical protein ACFCUQ_16935 [Kiloniellales bacterium]